MTSLLKYCERLLKYLTIRVLFAPRLKLFVSQGPKGPLQEIEEQEESARYDLVSISLQNLSVFV